MSFRTAYGYTHSENGWRMCNRDECVVLSGQWMDTAPVRRGAPEIILGDFARRYNAECAPLVSPVWGWSRDNDVANSNHLSGTACFAGETMVVTRSGPRSIASLAGRDVDVLTADPVSGGAARWVCAPIRSFGSCPTTTLRLSRTGRKLTIRATDDHRWFVRRVKRIEYTENGRRRTALRERVEEVTTDRLRPGDTLARAFTRPESSRAEPSSLGVAAGIVHGDGTDYDRGALVRLYGVKRELARFFPEPRMHERSDGSLEIDNLPRSFKQLPDRDESPGFLLGWIAGLIATDGAVSDAGGVEIVTSRGDVAEFIRDICPRLGIAVHVQKRERGPSAYKPGTDIRLRFDRSTLTPNMFVRSDQAGRFGVPEHGGRRWKVDAIEPGAVAEEVFCATVDGTRAFVLDGEILTGNCDINAPQWPWGLLRMPADLVGRIQTLVAWYEGAVFWGRNWGKPDEMHFQIGVPEGDPLLDRIVAKVVHGAEPAPPPYDPRTDPFVVEGFAQLVPVR